jgi:hypothetical protein
LAVLELHTQQNLTNEHRKTHEKNTDCWKEKKRKQKNW